LSVTGKAYPQGQDLVNNEVYIALKPTVDMAQQLSGALHTHAPTHTLYNTTLTHPKSKKANSLAVANWSCLPIATQVLEVGAQTKKLTGEMWTHFEDMDSLHLLTTLYH